MASSMCATSTRTSLKTVISPRGKREGVTRDSSETLDAEEPARLVPVRFRNRFEGRKRESARIVREGEESVDVVDGAALVWMISLARSLANRSLPID